MTTPISENIYEKQWCLQFLHLFHETRDELNKFKLDPSIVAKTRQADLVFGFGSRIMATFVWINTAEAL